MADKANHVLDHLPEYRHPICARMHVDEEFRSLCEDYGDAFEALQRWQVSADSRRKDRIEEFRRLLEELKAEILAGVGAR